LVKEEDFYVVFSESVRGRFQLTLGDIKFKVCPLSWITDDSWSYLELFQLCKILNVLPEEGGLLDQDNKTIEAFQIINYEFEKAKAKVTKNLDLGTYGKGINFKDQSKKFG